MLLSLVPALLLGSGVAATNPFSKTNAGPQVENRTLDEIHKAALAEGGVVTLWHGGDETNEQDTLKQAFEKRFPGMTLNVTVDLSKYHDAALDEQIVNSKVTVDSIILQTVHDYPRWKSEGVLLEYAPAGFDQIYPAYKDSVGAAYYGYAIFNWQSVWSTRKLPDATINEWEDFLKPALKNKLVLTYPNDDDAVLWAFDMLLQRYGTTWFDALLAQNPRWVRGTATPFTVVSAANASEAVTFTSGIGWEPIQGIQSTLPTRGPFVSWPQTGAILKDAPHPEGAKLLHNFILSPEYQGQLGWSVRQDISLPANFTWGPLDNNTNTNAAAFMPFMMDRARVGRLRDWFESKIGTAQGKSPLKDDI